MQMVVLKKLNLLKIVFQHQWYGPNGLAPSIVVKCTSISESYLITYITSTLNEVLICFPNPSKEIFNILSDIKISEGF